MTAEEILAAQLAHQLGRLKWGTRYRLQLEQEVTDHVRRSMGPGPHSVGWVARTSRPEELVARFVDTRAGRHARAMIEDELLDVVIRDSPPRIRLCVDEPVTVRLSDLRARGVVP
jgi:hypothetical protein